jgi:hypothetical protein
VSGPNARSPPLSPNGFILTFDRRQYTDFLEDLEEDEALRKNINIFRGEWRNRMPMDAIG